MAIEIGNDGHSGSAMTSLASDRLRAEVTGEHFKSTPSASQSHLSDASDKPCGVKHAAGNELNNRTSLEQSDESKRTAKHVQEQKTIVSIHSLLDRVLGQTASPESSAKAISELKSRLAYERTNGDREASYGPATQEAMQHLISWVEKHGLPEALRELDSHQMVVDVPSFAKWKDHSNQPAVAFDTHQLIAQKVSQASLGIDSTKVPSLVELNRLAMALNWINTVKREVLASDNEKFVVDSIQKNGLPKAWLDQGDLSKADWLEKANALYALSQEVGSRVDALIKMKKAGADIPIDLPPGTELLEENGVLKKISLDLPKSLVSDEEGKRKYEILDNWLKTCGSKIDQIARTSSHLHLWGDERGKGELVLNENSDVVDYAPESDSPNKTSYNLVERRFDVRNENGKIIIESTTQFQQSPWWNYMDMRPTNVGNVIRSHHEYEPDDYVSVPDGKGVKLIQAKDLEGWKNSSWRWHYGPKLLTGAMDVGFTITGGVGMRAAWKGLVGSRALGWSATHFGIGASGFISNSAGAYEHSSLRALSYARHAYFLASAAHHVAAPFFVGVAAEGAAGSRAYCAAKEIQEALYPAMASAPSSPRLYALWRLSNELGEKSSIAFAPIIANEIKQGSVDLFTPRTPLNLRIRSLRKK